MRYLILFLLVLLSLDSKAQIFFENFGTVNNVVVSNYNPIYVGNSTISSTTSSSNCGGLTCYRGASGQSNLFFRPGDSLVFNLNLSCFENISLDFGFFKSVGFVNGMNLFISDTKFEIGNVRNTNWQPRTFSDLPEKIIKIKFVNNSLSNFRIDDIFISGDKKLFQDTILLCVETDTIINFGGEDITVRSDTSITITTNDGCDSIVTILPKSCPLPVELLYFKGYQNNFTNILEWETSSEFNNDFFEIQRGDGDTKFYTIGKIKGNNIPSKYSFKDDKFDTSFKIFYYRFKQVDFDGSFDFSPIISIENSEVIEYKNIYLDLQGREITNIDNNPFYIKITIFNNGLIKSKKVFMPKF